MQVRNVVQPTTTWQFANAIDVPEEREENLSPPPSFLMLGVRGWDWLHEERAREPFPLPQRCRNVVGLEVAARGLTEVFAEGGK